jgi:hypothetical protein
MTRGKMEDELATRIGEYLGTTVNDNPFARRRAVWRSADKVAEATMCLHTGRTLSLVADQEEYCPPDLLAITSVLFKDSNDYWTNLPTETRARMDKMTGGLWRNDTTSTYPRLAVVTGPNRVRIYPTPSANVAIGLRIEGYYKAGETWVYDSSGVAQTPTTADDCPLPTMAHTCVLEGALLDRLQGLIVQYPQLAPAIGIVRETYRGLLGDVEANTARHYQSVANGAPRRLWI